MAIPKASKELMNLLNRAVASEMGAIIQYMWQHVTMAGIEAEAVAGAVRGIAMTEMGHAEKIAERLNYLGGMPTVKPDPVYVGGAIPAMIKVNVGTEEQAIMLYREVITRAEADGDDETALMFREIILEEQEHHNTFLTLLGDKVGQGEPRLG